jgi:hypothetical protein
MNDLEVGLEQIRRSEMGHIQLLSNSTRSMTIFSLRCLVHNSTKTNYIQLIFLFLLLAHVPYILELEKVDGNILAFLIISGVYVIEIGNWQQWNHFYQLYSSTNEKDASEANFG